MLRVARAAIAAAAAMALLGCGEDTPRALTEEARTDLAKSDVMSAVVRLKRAVQADPSSTAARTLLGEALLAADDPGGAAVELTKSLDQGGDREQVMPLLARALMLSKEFSQELEAVETELSRFTAIKPEGVLALGEIATNGRQSVEFFNKTFVIALGLA